MKNNAVRRKIKVNNLMEEVQHNLRRVRKKNKLTQSQLGAKLDVDQATISNFETGRTIMTMAQLYEMYLIFGDDFACPYISYTGNGSSQNAG
ncbi:MULTISPECIES: helix-turn-helix transcriptional regulator [Pseudoalteromonas]|uniref:Putative transcriptional regulator n=1 Tax=Pseudoalteromonas luteoviolacea (strain 2ta16) TaxID=1353533 RepID=V4JES4_PSEL2|nr:MULTISPECIES: helix-turn-helix transcriptional regulator [Pseudoalteromonas]ESP93537.1 putative transcriptional regulator [Pseudoalteromonas luteoviolacea 2ta16]MCG7548758.1 helix-turn-helix domain-containing protein [Pseudoalteromonas sp. Of7M-16]